MDFSSSDNSGHMTTKVPFKIEVVHDKQADVFIATSRDLPGLVVESKKMDTLFPEVYDCVNMLLESQLKSVPRSKPIAAWDGDFCSA